MNSPTATLQASDFWTPAQLRAMQGLDIEPWHRTSVAAADGTIAQAEHSEQTLESLPVSQNELNNELIEARTSNPTLTPQFLGAPLVAFLNTVSPTQWLVVCDADDVYTDFLSLKAKTLLNNLLAAVGLDLSAVTVAPLSNGLAANTVFEDDLYSPTMQSCASYWQQLVTQYQPRCVLALGARSAQVLLGVEGAVEDFETETHTIAELETSLLVMQNLETLLLQPSLKAQAWRQLQQAIAVSQKV